MRLLPSLVSLTAMTVLTPASAADVTDMPPRFRGDVAVGYLGAFEQVGLEEGGETYAIRNTTRHDLDVQAIFSLWSGVGLTLRLPTTASQTLAYPGAREMRLDPLTGEGSYAGGRAINPLPVQSGGFQGAWIGIAASPLREGWSWGLPVNLRADLAVRTPARKATLYGSNRGAAPGGAALQVGLALSKIVGRTDTWMSVRYTREFAASDVEVVLPNGDDGSPLTVREGDHLTARIGGVALTHRDPATGRRTGIGVWAGFDWLGEARRPSGFWLPGVVDTVRGTQVVASDRLAARLGLSFETDPLPQLGVRVGLDGSYLSPRFEEHPFPVATDVGSWAIGWNVTVIGRARAKGEPRIDGEAR